MIIEHYSSSKTHRNSPVPFLLSTRWILDISTVGCGQKVDPTKDEFGWTWSSGHHSISDIFLYSIDYIPNKGENYEN
jgi:hypothetical protein